MGVPDGQRKVIDKISGTPCETPEITGSKSDVHCSGTHWDLPDM